MRVSLLLAAFLFWPSVANACRQLSPEQQFEVSEAVVVGRISSATIPSLDSLRQGTTEIDALNRVVTGNRVLRIVVTETRKGEPVQMVTAEVNRCTGSFHNVGDRVIAYRKQDGTWLVSTFSSQSQERGP